MPKRQREQNEQPIAPMKRRNNEDSLIVLIRNMNIGTTKSVCRALRFN